VTPNWTPRSSAFDHDSRCYEHQIPQTALTSAASALLILITAVSSLNKVSASAGTCGNAPINLPFTDVAGSTFFARQFHFTGITNGTSATTFTPSRGSREQMSAFVTRTLDGAAARSSERAALNQFSTPTLADGLS
jgi:hypothetical protein